MSEEQTYRIGEAAELLNLKAYVLRFWETVFPELVPDRTSSGQRVYNEAHIELLRKIQALVHDQGMTLEGAKRILTAEKNSQHIDLPDRDKLVRLQRELEEIRNLLQG